MDGDFLDDDPTSSGNDTGLGDWIGSVLSDFGEGLIILFIGIVIILVLVAIIGHEADTAI